MGADTKIGVMLRVLHLRDSPWIDGPGRTILETATCIDREKVDYQVGVLVAEAGCMHPLLSEMRRRGLPAHEIVDNGTSMLQVVSRVIRLIDECRIDVLHTSEFRSNAIGVLCRMRRPVRLISTAHGWICNDMRGTVKSILDRIALRRFDRVIFVSEATRRRIPRWWVSDQRARILHNALVPGRFARSAEARPPLDQDEKRRVRILSVGRLSREKGQDLLLHAVAVLAREGREVCATIVGTGPLESELRKLSESLGIGNRVHFAGLVSEMTDAYVNADLLVQSSTTEGLPNVILEAVSLGLPIVATNVGGTAEVVEHGVSAWLVKPRSCDDLIEGIRHFLRHPGDFAAMSAVARATVESRFSLADRTRRQTEIYAELAASRG